MMAIYPKATKTSLAKLLRVRGMDIPSIRRSKFRKYGLVYWLEWYDTQGMYRNACYSACAGLPMLSVNAKFVPISMEEVIRFGLYEEK